MVSTMRLIAFSLLLVGCDVPRPNTDLCGVNAQKLERRCYNLKTDYDRDGNRKPNAKPKIKPARDVYDLDRNFCTDPDGFAELKAYIKKLREAAKCSAN